MFTLIGSRIDSLFVTSVLLTSMILAGCQENATSAEQSHGVGLASAPTVTATVYHPDFHGGPNYCDGSTYEHWGISAASSWLPCHTKVRVHHKGRVLSVYIKDRCQGCDLDLSAGAAHKLGVPLDGIADVQISY